MRFRAFVLIALTMSPTVVRPAQSPPQPRPALVRVKVDPSRLQVQDGDTVVVQWSAQDLETVRILGIDCPETRHLEHDIPFDQPFGLEASAFARGAFAIAHNIDLLRASTLDPYGRTLGYLFIDGQNYSIAVIEHRLAYESVTQFGDNGFPGEAERVAAAAKRAGPLPFEPPFQFRARMGEIARWMRARGLY